MKKLSLSLEELRVETFETGDTLSGRGTVRAHLQHTDPRACAHTNNWCCTVGDCSAGYTCAAWAWGTCVVNGCNQGTGPRSNIEA